MRRTSVIFHPAPKSTIRFRLLLSLYLPLMVIAAGGIISAAAPLDTRAGAIPNSKPSAVQNTDDVLRPGEVFRRNMAGGAAYTFQLPLKQNQCAHLIVEQHGIDVIVSIIAPSGERLIEMDSPNGTQGVEAATVIAAVSGAFSVEVRSPDKSALPGVIEARIDYLREATSEDASRVAAERAFVEGQIGRNHGTPESMRGTVRKYLEALAAWKSIGDRQGQAYTLCALGKLYREQGNLTEALKNFNDALAIWQEMKDGDEQSYLLNEIGAVYRKLDDPLKALPFYEQALALRQASHDESGQGQILNNIGLVYAMTGSFSKAVETYRMALPIWQGLGERNMEARTRNSMAGALDELGEGRLALENLQEILKFCQESGNRDLEAYVHNNIGKIYDTWGESQEALNHYNSAVSLYSGLNNLDGRATTLDNIGMLYDGLGDPARALDFLQEALEIRRQSSTGPRGEANTLTNIGYSYSMQGAHDKALQYYNLALPLRQQARDRQGEAYTLVSRGMSYAALGSSRNALEDYNRALQIQRELGDRRGQAITIDKISQVYALTGEWARARDGYNDALVIWRAIGDKQDEAISLYGLASAEYHLGDLDQSGKSIGRAIDLVESLRTKTTNRQTRATYFSTKQNFYQLDIEIKMALHRANPSAGLDAAALYSSERARARGLLDMLTEANVDITQGVNPALLEKKRDLERRMSDTAERSLRARSDPHRSLDADFLARQVEKLTKENDDIEARIRAESKAYRELSRPRAIGLKEIQDELLDGDTLLLEYSLGEQHSYLWLAAKEGPLKSYQLPGRAEIESLARPFRKTLLARQRIADEPPLRYMARVREAEGRYASQAAELGRMLLGPVRSELGKKRLLIITDGILQFIPFEALTLSTNPEQPQRAAGSLSVDSAPGQAPLVENHVITYEPSASTLALLRALPRAPAARTIAVLADPVFDSSDARLRSGTAQRPPEAAASSVSKELKQALRDIEGADGEVKFERLRFSGQEAEELMRLDPTGAGYLALGFKANKETVKSGALSRYRIVHFATHAVIDDNHPELSGIVLSLINERGEPQEGFLRINDIYEMRLAAELIVLSACRTGLGQEIKGEGLVGLTRAFMYAGARRVVASLWKVDDEATAEFMKLFYQAMLESRMSPGDALREAQMKMRARERWRSPYYWASFVIQGEPR